MSKLLTGGLYACSIRYVYNLLYSISKLRISQAANKWNNLNKWVNRYYYNIIYIRKLIGVLLLFYLNKHLKIIQ